jgi:hypothetical protein
MTNPNTDHLVAILERRSRLNARLAAATTFQATCSIRIQLAQTLRELTSEYEFLGMETPPEMTDDELLAALAAT